MTTGANPYVVPLAGETDDTGIAALETTLTASEAPVDIGIGVNVQAEVFNGAIPGPTFMLDVDETVIVRLVNDLPHPTGIHWHGIELENYSDGTELTQDPAAGAPLQVLGNGVPAGGTFLYKFKVTRPGIYWYHPHHHNSMNRVFRGMYGMIIVRDPLEANIVSTAAADDILPAEADTLPVVLSDITVCRTPGAAPPPMAGNYTATYADYAAAEWLSGVTAQTGPSPKALCEIAPAGSATDDEGNPAAASYAATFVPSIVRPALAGTPNFVEGQTVLTNGMNAGGRLGTPGQPGALAAGAPAPHGVLSGQGLRLQLANCSAQRYFRLRLTYPGAGGVGVQVPLVRIGGEGGLLDSAITEGGIIGVGNLNTNYETGEILLAPATRADVVAAIPADMPAGTMPVGTVLTLWTRDYQRVGAGISGNWAQLPTVPVMHFIVTGAKAGTPYAIAGGNLNATPPGGTALRGPAGMPATDDLGPLPITALLPGPASPPRPAGFVNADIKFRTSGGAPNVDNVAGHFMGSPTFAHAAHLGSSRYAEVDRVFELLVTNTSSAHHPFHLHGFSFQPMRYESLVGATEFTFPYREFRDTIDLPRNRRLRFRVRTDPRPLADDITPGGSLGRWMFHCHIFFHHEKGMVSEFVVTTADGREKPNVKVGGSWAYSPIPGSASRKGMFYHPNGLEVSLTATLASGTAIGTLTYPTGVSSGDWEWTYNSPPGDPPRFEYVYVTATDTDGRKDQAVFRLQIGGADTGSDIGDPHLRTVDGKRFDFQAAGEFTLLRDREHDVEMQIRQTPVETPPPITDGYSGLTVCVSLNTAFAARIGSQRIAFQPMERGRYRFFLDDRPALLTKDGIDFDGHRVSAFDAPEDAGLRIDFAHGMVVTVTPLRWTSYDIGYIDVHVANTQANEGIIGRIPRGTWLPLLKNGASLGPRPESLQERYVQLYKTFADSWRVDDTTSLFVYVPGTSTETFTDEDWPGAPPAPGDELPVPPSCELKPKFQKPLKPIENNIDLEEAQRICQDVTIDDLNAACVFDVATTGDAEFVKGYVFAQELRRYSTRVHIAADKPKSKVGERLQVTATVVASSADGPTPTGSVTFLLDGIATGPPVNLDAGGNASTTIVVSGPDGHGNSHGSDHGWITSHGDAHLHSVIRAAYTPDKTYHPSSSPSLRHTVLKPEEGGVGTTVVSLPTIWIWIFLLLLLLLIIMLGIHILG